MPGVFDLSSDESASETGSWSNSFGRPAKNSGSWASVRQSRWLGIVSPSPPIWNSKLYHIEVDITGPMIFLDTPAKFLNLKADFLFGEESLTEDWINLQLTESSWCPAAAVPITGTRRGGQSLARRDGHDSRAWFPNCLSCRVQCPSLHWQRNEQVRGLADGKEKTSYW